MRATLWTAANANLLYQTTRGAFLAQEKHSALGMLWHLLNPLLTTAVLYAVFSNVMHTTTIPHYPLFILLGLIQFNFFAHGTTRAAEGLLASRSLVLNTTVPREILMLRSVCLEAMTYLIEAAIVGLFVAVLGGGLSWKAAWFAVVIVAQFMLTAGVSFALGSAVVFLPDLTYVWGVATRLLFFLTPIFYSIDMLPQTWLRTLVHLNPIAGVVALGTRALLGGPPLTVWELLPVGGEALVVLVIGWRVFQVLKPHIPEYI